MVYAPVALFVFNRPLHMAQTVAALQANELAAETALFVYCDAARHDGEVKQVRKVREQAHAITGFESVTVVEREANLGLPRSIVETVSTLCEKFDKVIVLEDDLLTSPDFLRYMNQGLDLYAADERVASIHGYSYPVKCRSTPESYFLRGADCWGWATWGRAWRYFEPDGRKLLARLEQRQLGHRFDYDGRAPYMRMLGNRVRGRNQSWAILWHASIFLEGMLTLYPGHSLVANVGFDDSGVHCSEVDYFETEIGTAPLKLKKIEVEENEAMRACVVNFFGRIRWQRWLGFIRRPVSTTMRQANKLLKIQGSLR